MKVVETSRWGTFLGFILIMLFTAGVAKANNVSQDQFFKNILLDPPEQFVVSGLNKIPNSGHGKIAIDLGASVGHETKLLLQKGYEVIAVDSNARALQFLMLQPGIVKHKSKLKTINAKFEHINYSKLPQSDLIISSFALPFVPKKDFPRVWQNITSSIKPGGYIIINLFDPSYTFYHNQQDMTFHTKNEALALFNNFKIIEFREMRSDPLKPGSDNHYYVIVAKKLK